MSVANSLHLKKAVLAVVVCILGSALLTGCPFPPRIYRIDIEQGNIIEPASLKKLKKGMSKAQVQDVMGTPQLPHHIRPNRWDYYYSFFSGQKDEVTEKRVTLYFKKDRLVEIVEVLPVEEDCAE